MKKISLLLLSLVAMSAAAKPLTPPLAENLIGWQVWLGNGERILSNTTPPQETTNACISAVTLCDMPLNLSFALRARKAYSKVEVALGELKSENGTTLAATSDLRIVKAWYQDGNSWYAPMRDSSTPVLVPELLLHDDSLVTVDTKTRSNIIRSADGKTRTITMPAETVPADFIQTGFLAADDAKTLQPFAIALNETRQLVLTLNIPADAKDGVYNGKVSVKGDGTDLGSYDVAIRVIAQRLPLAIGRYSEDFWSGKFDFLTPGTRPMNGKTPTIRPFIAAAGLHPWTSPSIENFLLSSGITTPITELGSTTKATVPSIYSSEFGVLRLEFEEVTKKTSTPLTAGQKNNSELRTPNSELTLADFSAKVSSLPKDSIVLLSASDPALTQKLEAIYNLDGIKALYEATTNDLVRHPEYVDLALGNFFLRQYENPNAGPRYNNRTMEAYHALNIPYLLNVTTPASIADGSYWRRYLGFQCYLWGYDGFILPSAMECTDPWNDFASASHPARAMLFPTKTSLIPTLAWLGVNDAIVDVRIFSFARRLANKTRAADYFKYHMEGEKFGNWLNGLDPETLSLDLTRLELLAWIDRLEGIAALANGGKGMPADTTLSYPSSEFGARSSEILATPSSELGVRSSESQESNNISEHTKSVQKNNSELRTPNSELKNATPAVQVRRLNGDWSRAKGTELVNGVKGKDPAPLPKTVTSAEEIEAYIAYDNRGFTIALEAKSPTPVKSMDDLEGTIDLYLNDGNASTGRGAPVALTYDMTRRPTYPAPKENTVGLSRHENLELLRPLSRVTYHTKAYSTSATPLATPTIEFHALTNTWLTTIRFTWSSFRDRLPLNKMREPIPWRLSLSRTTKDGKTTTWGGQQTPIIIKWEKPTSIAIATDIENIAFGGGAGNAKNIIRSQKGYWVLYKQEGEIIYADPGRATFEHKNPASDKIYLHNYLNWLAEKQEAKEKEKVANRTAKLRNDREAIYFQDVVSALRRDYLLTRFLNLPIRPVRALTAEEIARKEQAEREKAPATIDGNNWDTGDTIINLDF